MLTLRKPKTPTDPNAIDLTDDAAVHTRARQLVERGAPYMQDEQAVLRAAWRVVKHAPVRDGIDVLLVHTAAAMAPRVGVPRFTGSTPHDEAIAAAQSEVAALTSEELTVRAEVQRLERALRVRKSEAQQAALRDQLSVAKESYLEVDRKYLRARTRLNALDESRARWIAEHS